MNQMLNKCPVCKSDLFVTRLHCMQCSTTIEGHFHPEGNTFAALSPEQMQFLLTFIRCEGRFNRMEEEMGLSYPTLRNRFNEILRALGFEPGREETPVRLTADDRMRVLDDLAEGRISPEDAQMRLLGKKEDTPEKEQQKEG
jgi:hypothetical protein